MTKTNQVSPIVGEGNIKLTLHTKSAINIWNGRAKTDTKYGLMGLPGFSSKMRILENAIKKDDPYAYYHYSVVQDAIAATSEQLDVLDRDIDAILALVPKALTVPDVSARKPMEFDILFASHLGFKAMYQLIKVDNIVMKILKAKHVALISTKEKVQYCNMAESKMRALFNVCYQYHFCDVTRDDMAANNQKAQLAISKMGELEEGYLTGETQVPNAPRLPDRRLATMQDDLTESELATVLNELTSDFPEAEMRAG